MDELEHIEIVTELLDKICAATERRVRKIVWFGLKFNNYIAWWKNNCVFVFDCIDSKFELRIVDSARRHETVIINETEYKLKLQKLKTAISSQVELRYSQSNTCKNKLGFLNYVSKNL